VYWRTDGEALWQNPDLIAGESRVRPASIADTQHLMAELCRRLGLDADTAIPAYEDAAHLMLIEQRLPFGIGPGDERLGDAAERQRLMRAFDRGLGTPTGYVLPLLLTEGPDRRRKFATERWAFRRGHLILTPGDSPIGLRLPLGSLPEI